MTRVFVIGTRGIPELLGGVEKHCEQLYPRLARLGYEITVFCRASYFDGAKRPKSWNDVNLAYIWAPRCKGLETIAHTVQCVFFCLLKRPDIVHVHNIGPGLFIPFLRMARIKTVLTYHSMNYLHQKWGVIAKSFLRLGERVGCTWADHVIFVAKSTHGMVSQRYRCHSTFIANGVESPTLLPPAEALGRRGLAPRKYILAVGRIVPEKGFLDLLKAFISLESDWKLVIAGTADHEDNYSRSVRDIASQHDRVVLTGFVKGDDLRELYSNAGLFILPSHHEGLPIALLEAVSYGLPVLASDIPANREFVDEGNTFPVGNTEVLRDLLAQHLPRPFCFPKDRELVMNEYDWDKIAEKTAQVFADL